ncbi:MAG: DUF58 domain-containing protein [Flavobacteriales bacterium]|nr:DUF58 domain-containing protein [Flavobacteriales bacterium]
MKKLDNIFLSSNIELYAKQVVEGFITGLHKSPYHGFSVEFAEHRLYNTGESTKHIDWKLFARTEKLFIKQYQEETNLRCQIIIDSSSSMYYPNFKNPSLKSPNKLFFAVYASAVLINLLKRQRDAIGISIFSDNLDFHTLSKSTDRHHKLLYHELKKILESNAIENKKKTYSSAAIHQISEIIKKRSLVIIFSDMINEQEDIDKQFESYKHLKYNKHEVILFHLSESNTEIDFEFDSKPYNFIDVETGEMLKLNPLNFKQEYKRKSKEFQDKLRLKCLQYKIDLVEVDINDSFDKILTSYLLKRKKMF